VPTISAAFSHPVAHAPSAARALPVERAPPVGPDAFQMARHRALMASYAMTDLRAEINRRRGGEDGRVTIERRRERRRDIEGRNLEKDFDSHAPSRRSPSAREAYPPSSPGVTGGGVHGASATSADGGLAAQVPAPPAVEVRRDRQPRGVPADLLHLYPCDRGG
jgi:hypothetical protein